MKIADFETRLKNHVENAHGAFASGGYKPPRSLPEGEVNEWACGVINALVGPKSMNYLLEAASEVVVFLSEEHAQIAVDPDNGQFCLGLGGEMKKFTLEDGDIWVVAGVMHI